MDQLSPDDIARQVDRIPLPCDWALPGSTTTHRIPCGRQASHALVMRCGHDALLCAGHTARMRSIIGDTHRAVCAKCPDGEPTFFGWVTL